MSKLTPKASKILLKVADLIEANPEHYNQNDYAQFLKTGKRPVQETACNTVCCVAGWVDYVINPKEHVKHVKISDEYDFFEEAVTALGLSWSDGHEIFDLPEDLDGPWGPMLAYYNGRFLSAKKPVEAKKYRALYAQTGAEMVRDFVRNRS